MDISKYFKKGVNASSNVDSKAGDVEFINGKKPLADYKECDNRKKQRVDQEAVAVAKADITAHPESEASTSTSVKISQQVQEINFVNDIGQCIMSHLEVPEDMRYELILNPWTPSKDYNFKNDIVIGSRPFKVERFQTYPWLVYSNTLKGALCRHCVLFRPIKTHGSCLGRFIVKPHQNYKEFHKAARSHMNSKWHAEATLLSKNFISVKENRTVNVEQQINTSYQRKIAENREKLKAILSTLLLCAIHDLPLRGKDDTSAVFNSLLQFRVESGDNLLKQHFQTSGRNAQYISHRIQNELLEICSTTLRRNLVSEINKAPCFSLIADETADIQGTEHLSICVRFIKDNCIHEDFLGFFPLDQFDAEYIASTILNTCKEIGLDMSRCVGQGYDGCSTMAGHISGVQSRIQNVFPMANFFHCSSHRLNLVINDLNNLSDIRNTVSTIKETIRFIKDSAIRLNVVGSTNVKKLCATRWTEKHKSIRHFSDNFIAIIEGLEHISTTTVLFNSKVRQTAHQLLCALSTPSSIITLKIIAKYSAKFEPITSILQGVSVDLLEATSHVQELLTMLKSDRQNADVVFEQIFEDSMKTAETINVELKAPRRTVHQANRANYPTENVGKYFKQALYIPYMDSIITSITDRFSDEKKKYFHCFICTPKK